MTDAISKQAIVGTNVRPKEPLVPPKLFRGREQEKVWIVVARPRVLGRRPA